MAKLLGIDVGTSGCKVLLVDESGAVLRQASAEYPLNVPRPLWSEQNPEDWWAGVQKCLAEIDEPNVDGIGVTGQMHGAVFLDGNDEVIRPAILWNDQRTAAECREIDQTVGEARVRAITCNPPLTGFQVPKLLWLRNNELSNYQKVRSLLLPKDYIRFKLTGDKATEVSDASGTGVFDVPNRRWSPEMLRALELDAAIFPRSVESSVVTGKTASGVRVVGGGGDQAAGAVGTGAVVPGVISVSLGTSGVVFTAVDAPNYDPGGAAHTFCHANGAWHVMGVMLSCGGALRWYRDTLCHGMTYDAISAEAEGISPGSDGLTFLPYLTGERCPHNDPYARAAFAGLTLGTHPRSLESSSVRRGQLRPPGRHGPVARAWRLGRSDSRDGRGRQEQVLDATCWPICSTDLASTLACDEGPAYGAAILAGVGIGLWPDVATACEKTVQIRNVVDPHRVNYSGPYVKYRELYSRTGDWNSL